MEQELNRIIENTKKAQQVFLDTQTENPIPLMSSKEKLNDEKPKRDHYYSINGIPMKYKTCTLDEFQGGDVYVEAIRKLSDSIENMVLIGKTGSGKTHLAIGMLKIIDVNKIPCCSRSYKSDTWDDPPEKYFITLPEVLLRIRDSFKSNPRESEADVVNYFSDIDCLVLDDLGAEKPSEFSVATLYLILDRRINNCRQTIITTNLEMQEIEQIFGARIASRLSEMKIIKINMPDYRKKRGAK